MAVEGGRGGRRARLRRSKRQHEECSGSEGKGRREGSECLTRDATSKAFFPYVELVV